MADLAGKLIRKLLLSFPGFWEKYGLHITPDHFYYPIPSLRDMPPDFFEQLSSCPGMDWNYSEQQTLFCPVFRQYSAELAPCYGLKMMSSVDAAAYYSLIRYAKPAKIVEIGGGESTRIAAQACVKNRNEGHTCELTCIEPFSQPELERGFEGLARLIVKKVQDVPPDFFSDYDMVFIDSSHVVKMGSDVLWEMLEVVPRLKPELIHWHDIFLPGDYLRELFQQRLFWSEQYLLRAFLMYNSAFKVIWASQFMRSRDAQCLRETFRDHALHEYPVSSFWVQRVG